MAGSGHSSYATLASVTLANHANKIFDNVLTNNAALNELKRNGNILVVSGGSQFTHPVYYQKNNSFASMSKYGTIATDLQDPLTRAVYDIKVLAGSVVYSLVDEAMNAGDKQKLIDYLDAIEMDAQTSMSELMGDQIMQADASIGSNDFDSIPRIISDSPTTQTCNVGGIDSSTDTSTFWQNYAYTTAITSFSANNAGINAFDTAYFGAQYGRQGPTFGITTKALLTLYNNYLTPNVRYSDTERANAGFKNLMYATMPIMPDDNCAANHCYFIDGKSLRLQVLAKGNLKMTSFTQAYSQLMERALLYILGNLTCGSRRTNAVITAISG